MLTSYVLYVFLVGGGLRVSVEPDFWSCRARLQFEARFDPRIVAKCIPHEGSWA